MLYYATFTRFPSENANSKQIKEMCNALVLKVPVTIVVPTRHLTRDIESFGLHPDVRLVYLPTIDLVRFGKFGFGVSLAVFLLLWTGYLLLQTFRKEKPMVLTREYSCAVVPALLRVPTAWESHRGEWNRVIGLIAKLRVHFFVISKGLQSLYREKGVQDDQITLVPDGVDLLRYQNLPSREEARQQLGLDPNTFIALYNGSLHTWKGADTLAEAAALLPDDMQVMFMGGADWDIEKFTEKYGDQKSIAIIGRKSDMERPVYLRAADVLVLPNTAKNEISVKYTSPLKLFGYMAAETPIIASDLPSIREVVSEKEVFFAEPDDPQSFADAMLHVRHNPEEAQRRASNARAVVEEFSWDKRAEQMFAIFQK